MATPVGADHARRPSVQRIGTGGKDSNSSSVKGISRTGSVKGSPLAKPGHKKNMSSVARGATTDDAQAEAASLIEDLKAQLRKAEDASDEYQRELHVARTQLEDARNEQVSLEISSQSYQERLEKLERAHDITVREHRALQGQHDEEKAHSERDKEQAHMREGELQETILKLKESLSMREHRMSVDGDSLLARSASRRGRTSPRGPPESPLARRNSSQHSQSNLILQKDKVIEELRLELAEAQVKIVERENAGGGRLQELEKQLLDARMSNAKLLEDNESYQVLLSEKTLNGDFAKSDLLGLPSPSPIRDRHSLSRQSSRGQSGNLADELAQTDDEHPTADSELDRKMRRLENELSTAKDQNKALTLYINKIISRLLANEQFEKLFVEGDSHSIGEEPTPNNTSSHAPGASISSTNKDLPPAPANEASSAGSSFLSRAGSIFGGRRARPGNIQPPSVDLTDKPLPNEPPVSAGLAEPNTSILKRRSANLNEDPMTAPSLPLRRNPSTRGSMASRGHRRANSEWSAAAAAANSNRIVSVSSSTPSGPLSPALADSPRRASFIPTTQQPPLILEDNERQESGETAQLERQRSSSSPTNEGSTSPITEAPEPSSPRSMASAALEGRGTSSTGLTVPSSASSASGGERAPSSRMSWFSGQGSAKPNQMRPLRLVQEKQEADEERKRANRTSFMTGWFSQAQVPKGDGQDKYGGLERTEESVRYGSG